MRIDELTDNKYWNDQWSKLPLPSIVDVRTLPGKIFHSLFSRYLSHDATKHFLEIGCAPGSWLYYFAKHFGYLPFGIEYTPAGYAKTMDNLTTLGLPAHIVNSDYRTAQLPVPMDIVFSFGLIEHFHDTAQSIHEHFRFIKDNGTLIIIIPNLSSALYAHLQRIIDKDVFNAHKIISLQELRAHMSSFGCTETYSGYAGVFNLGLMNRPRMKAFNNFIINHINGLAFRLITLFNITVETKFFSPYIVYIGTYHTRTTIAQ